MTEQPPTATDIDPAAARLSSTGSALLDVREDDEWEAGHAPRPCTWPWGWCLNASHEIPDDRTVVCVCRVGGRSGAVAGALAGQGYDVRNLDGGMLAWEAAGLPVVTDHGDVGRIV